MLKYVILNNGALFTRDCQRVIKLCVLTSNYLDLNDLLHQCQVTEKRSSKFRLLKFRQLNL